MTKTGYDKQGNLIDLSSHRTHAMNPIDWALYDPEVFPHTEEWEHHIFKCMFCGALDDTPAAAMPCPVGRENVECKYAGPLGSKRQG